MESKPTHTPAHARTRPHGLSTTAPPTHLLLVGLQVPLCSLELLVVRLKLGRVLQIVLLSQLINQILQLAALAANGPQLLFFRCKRKALNAKYVSVCLCLCLRLCLCLCLCLYVCACVCVCVRGTRAHTHTHTHTHLLTHSHPLTHKHTLCVCVCADTTLLGTLHIGELTPRVLQRLLRTLHALLQSAHIHTSAEERPKR